MKGALRTDGEAVARTRRYPAGPFNTLGSGRDLFFGFLTLIELFTIYQLRCRGVSMHTLREAKAELARQFNTAHPFALRGLLTDCDKLLMQLGNDTLLELGTGGQTAFETVLSAFCSKLDFDTVSNCASRFYPEGRESGIVVDPWHAFGKPTVNGTNITTEAIASLLRAGEDPQAIAHDFGLTSRQVEDVQRFEHKELKMAA